MLSVEGCRNRRRRLWEVIPKEIDWALFADPQHLIYFANYLASPFEFSANDAGAVLLLGRDGGATLIADNLVRHPLDLACVDDARGPVWYQGKRSAPRRQSRLVESALDVLREKKVGDRLGVESSSVPLGIVDGLRQERPSFKPSSIDDAAHRLRRKKDPDELALLRQSVRAGEAGFAALLESLKPGMTELDAFLLVQEAATRSVGAPTRIYGDFVSGPRCEKVGGPPSSRIIERGDLFILDFSVIVWGYRADFANTFAVGARPAAEQQKLGDACLEAMAEGEKVLGPGRPAQEVDRAVRGSLEAKGLGGHYHSHVGHGLGLGHPEAPYIVPESTETLEVGDVVTLEPGQYVAGVGGMRFEHNYLITESGFERLTGHALTMTQPGV